MHQTGYSTLVGSFIESYVEPNDRPLDSSKSNHEVSDRNENFDIVFENGQLELQGYTDADYAVDIDTRRSTC